MKTKIYDASKKAVKLALQESSEVDNVHVLAKVKGTFFCPDSTSRNNRYYSKNLWENVLSRIDIQEQFKLRNMFGTVGHNVEITDESLGQGKISHVVTNAYIDEEGNGIGEALVLNTPSGQVLNTLLRAGCTVYVSSRGEGTFEGTSEEGCPKVNEEDYNLLGWDFVIKPGFLQANPKVVEELEKIEKNNNVEGEFMDKLMEKLMNENADLRAKLGTALEEVKELKSIKENLDSASKELNGASVSLKEAQEEIKSLTESLNEKTKLVESYEKLTDSPAHLEKSLLSIKKHLEEYNEVGTKNQIVTALKKAIAFKDKVESYGSLPNIVKALSIAEKLVKESQERLKKDRISGLAQELMVSEDAVSELVEKGLTDDDIKGMFIKVAESLKAGSKYKKTEANKEISVNEKEEGTKKTVVSSLIEHFSR